MYKRLRTLESLLIGAVIFFHIDPFEQSLMKYSSHEWREDVLFSHILKLLLNHNDYRKLNHGSFGFWHKYLMNSSQKSNVCH